MADWNELFNDVSYQWSVPESELLNFINLLEKTFPERPLRFWDLGCGTGRHTLAIARRDHQTYASDSSPRAIELAGELLNKAGVEAFVRQADMTQFPWDDDIRFHGVFSWNVLHHNTLDNIVSTIDIIYEKLVPGGMLLANLLSDKADSYGRGREIEPGTFISDAGDEAGVPHHHFDETGIKTLFGKNRWEFTLLFEQVVKYAVYTKSFELAPLPYTNWVVIVKKTG